MTWNCVVHMYLKPIHFAQYMIFSIVLAQHQICLVRAKHRLKTMLSMLIDSVQVGGCWFFLKNLNMSGHQVETTEHVQCDSYMHIWILLSSVNGTMSAHALVAKWVVQEVASLLQSL